jgi:hypothetical protein
MRAQKVSARGEITLVAQAVGNRAIGRNAVRNDKGQKDFGPIDCASGKERVSLVDEVEESANQNSDDQGPADHTRLQTIPDDTYRCRIPIHTVVDRQIG